MAAPTTGGANPPEKFLMLSTNMKNNGGKLNLNPVSFASSLKPKGMQPNVLEVPIKLVTMLYGEPCITWKSSEVRVLIAKENLYYVIIGKFAYGKVDIVELQKQILGQCGIKSECTV